MKYELVLEAAILSASGAILRRIRRISDGTLGGYIESEKNLSQDGDDRVSGDAWVFGNAEVSEDTLVFGKGNRKQHKKNICD